MLSTMLIVDDEESICLVLKRFFKSRGFDVHLANDGMSAIGKCKGMPVDIVLLDLRLPDMSGLDALQTIKTISPETAVIIITAYGDVETAVKAMQMKADNFTLKPVDLSALESMVARSLESHRTQAKVQYLERKLSRLEGSDRPDRLRQPQEVCHAISLLADNPSTNVLITGETGTGKGMVAHVIHELSNRALGEFVDINCAGLDKELLESELFGHEQGAFTDARTRKNGLLEIANKGSLFMDEIGEMSLPVQAKLLKVIETKSFRRLGGTANIEVDVRIIAATNSNIEKAVKDGKFRKDLYFRLNVMPIALPPLRERRDDILPLARQFLDDFNKQFLKHIKGFSAEAESILLYYSWPGNIRELKNVTERAALLCENDQILTAHLPANLKSRTSSMKVTGIDDMSLESMEKKLIESALAMTNNNRVKAAKLLGIHRTTLIKKIKGYNLE